MIYFNNAAKARFDPQVVATGVACIEKDPWEMMNAEDDKAQVRTLYAKLLGVVDHGDAPTPTPTTIAIMPSTAFAITLAAQNLQRTIPQGGKILLLQDQYPSAVYPWQDICATSGGKFSLEVVPYPQQGETWTSLILERLASCDSIAIACLPPLFWCTGAIIDLELIGPLCKEKGIPLIVDATQAVGIYPVHVPNIPCAMIACSVHKWLRGPSGTCLVYIEPSLVESWQPLDQHDRARDWQGRSVADRGAMSPTDGYPSEFLPGTRKFDAGGRTQPILMPMLRAALESVVTLDTAKAQLQLQALVKPLRDWAAQSPLVQALPAEAHASHILGLTPTLPKTTQEMLDMAKQLMDTFHIAVAVRCGVFRISPYVDNTAE